jgi:uncharacterized protein YecE (DUF72 family)
MATRYHVGAKELQGKLSAYAKRFDFLEVRLPAAGAPSSTPTKPATLRGWRRQVPPSFDFCVVLGPAVSRLKPGAALDAELETGLAAVNALEARCLMIATPTEVTPSPLSRERLAKLVARLPRDATQIVWEPHGLWEHDDAASLARKLGVVLAVDAARDPVPPGPVAYVRLRALGETRSFSSAALERVVDAIGPRREAWVVIETPTALAECKRLRRAAQGGAKRAAARPFRASPQQLRARDDEQE